MASTRCQNTVLNDGRINNTYQMVIVIAVPADGAITLAKILYLRPSMAKERVKPMIAAFAAEYCNAQMDIERMEARYRQATYVRLTEVTVCAVPIQVSTRRVNV